MTDDRGWDPPPVGKHEKCVREVIRLESKNTIQSQILRLSIGVNVAFIMGLTLRLLLIK